MIFHYVIYFGSRFSDMMYFKWAYFESNMYSKSRYLQSWIYALGKTDPIF